MINRVLLYNSGGGIGDAIQMLSLLNTLKNELKNTKFYYLSAHENHFNSTLKDLNCEIESLNLKIKYFGFRWWHALIVQKRFKMLNIESFDLILDLQSKIRNSLILKMIRNGHMFNMDRDRLRDAMEDITFMLCPDDDANQDRVERGLEYEDDEIDDEIEDI